MIYKLEVRSLAALEIIDAYDWYELQCEGLGTDFLQEVEMIFEGLKRNPDLYSYYEKPVRQVALNRFPYTIVYEVFNENLIIYSVFMTKQDPSKKRKQ